MRRATYRPNSAYDLYEACVVKGASRTLVLLLHSLFDLRREQRQSNDRQAIGSRSLTGS
jgi:hypothetical protein